MEIRDYLTEIVNANEKIERDCKPYLKLLKGREPLYRGMKVGIGIDEIGKKKVRKGRKARGMSDEKLNAAINKWLKSEGHVRRDRCVITSPSVHQVKRLSSMLEFSNVYYVFPIGNLKYTWIESKDFNETKGRWDPEYLFLLQKDKYMKKVSMYMKPDYWKDEIPRIESKLEIATGTKDPKKGLAKFFTSNNGFDTAYQKGYEIWFGCKEYYFIYPVSVLGHRYNIDHVKAGKK